MSGRVNKRTSSQRHFICAVTLAVWSCSANQKTSIQKPAEKNEQVPRLILPIEVIDHAPGFSQSVSLQLPSVSTQEFTRLSLSLHNIVETNAFFLSINNNAPIDLGDATLPFVRDRGEVVTASFDVPSSQFVAGTNSLTFRYDRQVPNVSGFRVLKVEILGDVNASLEGDLEDPSKWLPFRNDTASIARGKSYFTEVSRDMGPTCGTCHTDDGEDLQYFSFSNHSIVSRAMFHKFSREEAEDIASYIRSLDVPRLGRLYRPPFQPGALNIGSAGAGPESVISRDSFAEQFGDHDWATAAATTWDWAKDIDLRALRAPVQVPTWFRWLPRDINPDWFTMHNGELAKRKAAFDTEPTLENAQAFASSAIGIGKEIFALKNDYQGRIELLRYMAVKLWNFSRKLGFDRENHGFPEGLAAYPYEVGFAFFEGGLKYHLPIAEWREQALGWWWVQLAVNSGRGFSDGQRPLNYEDVQKLADEAQLGPQTLVFLHILGSWEESRGSFLEPKFGTDLGPVRLLLLPMQVLPTPARQTLMKRYLLRESQFFENGGTVDALHQNKLRLAWAALCPDLTSLEREALRVVSPPAERGMLSPDCN